jgi:hypothetical protein
MQANEQDEALENLANGKAPKPKRPKSATSATGITQVEGMAGSLAQKSTSAQHAAIATADRDSLTFAQTYLTRFDANMQAINGKLSDAWQTVGQYDQIAEGEEMPPFEQALEALLNS